MQRRILFLVTFVLVSTLSFAQETARKIYPDPQLTLEVQTALDSREVWRPSVSTRSIGTIPAFVDNSLSKYFPPLINQQGGSCAQASSIGYVFTYEINRLLDRDASLSAKNRFSYLYSWNFLNEGIDQGGFAVQGFSLLKGYGAMSEEDYGYASTYSFKWATGYDKYLNAIKHKVDKMYDFDSSSYESIEKIKSYLYDKGDGLSGGGLLTISAYSSGWKFDTDYSGPSNTGYKDILTQLATTGAHAMTVVGYDDAVESYNAKGEKCLGAFILVNSWGSFSHDNGRFYLPYHFFIDARDAVMPENVLASSMDAISVKVVQPEVVMRVKLDYSSRDDLSIQYGASRNYVSPYPIEKFTLPILRNQGGDYPMQGQYEDDTTFEFAIDLSDLFQKYDNIVRLYLNVLASQRGDDLGSGKIISVEVYDYRENSSSPEIYEAVVDANKELKWGENYFTLTPKAVSASRYNYRDSDKKLKSYYIKRANGGYSKIEIDASDFYYDDKLRIKHKSSLRGGVNLTD